MSPANPAFPTLDPPRPPGSLWLLQVLGDHKSEEEAHQALSLQRTQDGFVGGRVYRTNKSGQGPWRAQSFHVDEPAMKDSVMPDGMRRVLVLRSQVIPLGIHETLFLTLLERKRPEGVVVRQDLSTASVEVSKLKEVDRLTARLRSLPWDKIAACPGAAKVMFDIANAYLDGLSVSRFEYTGWKFIVEVVTKDLSPE